MGIPDTHVCFSNLYSNKTITCMAQQRCCCYEDSYHAVPLCCSCSTYWWLWALVAIFVLATGVSILAMYLRRRKRIHGSRSGSEILFGSKSDFNNKYPPKFDEKDIKFDKPEKLAQKSYAPLSNQHKYGASQDQKIYIPPQEQRYNPPQDQKYLPVSKEQKYLPPQPKDQKYLPPQSQNYVPPPQYNQKSVPPQQPLYNQLPPQDYKYPPQNQQYIPPHQQYIPPPQQYIPPPQNQQYAPPLPQQYPGKQSDQNYAQNNMYIKNQEYEKPSYQFDEREIEKGLNQGLQGDRLKDQPKKQGDE